jgi:hypothetical protein
MTSHPEPSPAPANAAGIDHDDEDDDHIAHGGPTLGPIDVQAWGAGVLGVALGLVVALCLVLATQPVAAA